MNHNFPFHGGRFDDANAEAAFRLCRLYCPAITLWEFRKVLQVFVEGKSAGPAEQPGQPTIADPAYLAAVREMPRTVENGAKQLTSYGCASEDGQLISVVAGSPMAAAIRYAETLDLQGIEPITEVLVVEALVGNQVAMHKITVQTGLTRVAGRTEYQQRVVDNKSDPQWFRWNPEARPDPLPEPPPEQKDGLGTVWG